MPRYEDTAEGVAAQDGPQERAGKAHAWKPGDRVHFAGKNWDILAIADNGVFIGNVRGGVSFNIQFVSFANSTLQRPKWD